MDSNKEQQKEDSGNNILSICLAIGGIVSTPNFGWIGIAICSTGILLFVLRHMKVSGSQLHSRQLVVVGGALIILNLAVTAPLLMKAENFIYFIERYVEFWDSSKSGDVRLDKRILKKKFVDGQLYRLTPGVENQYKDSRIDELSVMLSLPKEIDVVTTVGQNTYWRISGGTTYFARIFGGISDGYINNVSEPLHMKFSKPGIYVIRYSISGEIRKEGARGFKLNGRFALHLAE